MLVFLHLGSRKVFLTVSTGKPNATWMAEQVGKFLEHVKSSGQEITLLLRDRNVVHGKGFDKTVRDAGIRVKKNSVRAPNLQVQRYVQSI